MGRRWLNVELENGVEANTFRQFLIDQGIEYESMGAYNLIHFSCYMNDDEAQLAAEVLADF